ncbi:MAG: FAD:protein FMN transferase, partial [Bacteroidota bacterium]
VNVRNIDEQGRDFLPQFDSLLKDFNQALSTYIPNSEISTFNRGETDTVYFKLPYFYPVLVAAREVWQKTDGTFDPTVFPLVQAWGFGPDGKTKDLSDATVDSLKALVDFGSIKFDDTKVWKTKPNVQLDFSAIAKGYAVDILGEYLETQDVGSYVVEVGGEVRCKGKKPSGDVWAIGIEDPTKSANDRVPLGRVFLEDRSMATSGNYRNFYVRDGKRYVHTINPRTGYPIEHQLLSASVLTKDCMRSDAYATAFMVMGREQSMALAEKYPSLEAFLVYDDEGYLKTTQTAGLEGKTELRP